MSIEKRPYVGVSGVVNIDQQFELQDTWHELEAHKIRDLLLGVKAVHNTQWLDRENKYGPTWYPIGALPFANAMFGNQEGVKGVAQIYLDPEAIASDPTYAERFVDRIQQRGWAWLEAMQFDMLPYDIEDTARWRDLLDEIHGNRLETIVQCHQRAMSTGPTAAVERLKQLGPVDYILFDASHGTGKEMDPDDLSRYLDAAYSDEELTANGTLFGIAGGLNADRVYRHMPTIVRRFPNVSWDAEGQLHKSVDNTHDRSLDMAKTNSYLYTSADIIEEAM